MIYHARLEMVNLDRGKAARGIIRFLILAILLISCVACQKQRLIVETYFLDKSSLASSWVGTPNPLQHCPTTGQELIISWRLPDEFRDHDDLRLVLTLRFGNREDAKVEVPICRFRGNFRYRLVDQEYWDVCGIMTYKVELYAGDCLLDSWYHQIWSEMIDLESYDAEEKILDACHWKDS